MVACRRKCALPSGHWRSLSQSLRSAFVISRRRRLAVETRLSGSRDVITLTRPPTPAAPPPPARGGGGGGEEPPPPPPPPLPRATPRRRPSPVRARAECSFAVR